MAYFKGVVYLTKTQYENLYTNGTLTVGGNTINYDENVLYVTDKDYLESVTTGTGEEVYIHDGQTQSTVALKSTPTANAVSKYDANGNLKTSTPLQSNDCVNKGYVDAISNGLGFSNTMTLNYNSDIPNQLTSAEMEISGDVNCIVAVDLSFVDSNNASRRANGVSYIAMLNGYSYLPIFNSVGAVNSYACVSLSQKNNGKYVIIISGLPSVSSASGYATKNIKIKFI